MEKKHLYNHSGCEIIGWWLVYLLPVSKVEHNSLKGDLTLYPAGIFLHRWK